MPDDEPRAVVDPSDYRRVIGRFATGVTVVTTYDDDDVHAAMTVNSLTSISLEPVLVLISVEKIARFHDAVLAAKVWAVSVLGADAESVSRTFAKRGRPGRDQLAGHATTPGPVTGLPLLDGAIATLECRTWATYEGGDHTLVVGEVLSVAAPLERPPPLLYFESRYRSLPG